MLLLCWTCAWNWRHWTVDPKSGTNHDMTDGHLYLYLQFLLIFVFVFISLYLYLYLYLYHYTYICICILVISWSRKWHQSRSDWWVFQGAPPLHTGSYCFSALVFDIIKLWASILRGIIFIFQSLSLISLLDFDSCFNIFNSMRLLVVDSIWKQCDWCWTWRERICNTSTADSVIGNRK